MGALVLILVVVVSQASASANRPTPVDEEILAASDSIHLMSEEMIAQRDRQQQEIEKRRLDLTAIEDHISKLVDELEHYQELAKAIDDRKTQTENDRAEQAQKIEDMKSRIESEKERLAELRAKAKGNSPAFAIFPYQGKNGTTRRPIYLECVEGGVIIQPEGTLLSIEDLKPPFGPGNPLDSSLRLIRSEFQSLDPNSTTGVSPYPLLLVRPNGIKSYVLARAAMAGWDDQFGYELLDQQMPLAFPPTIPGLAIRLESNLVIARERQVALAAAMPRRYAGGQPWEEELDALNAATDRSGGGGEGGFSGSESGELGFGEDWTAIDSTFVRSPVQPMASSTSGVRSTQRNSGTGNGGGTGDFPQQAYGNQTNGIPAQMGSKNPNAMPAQAGQPQFSSIDAASDQTDLDSRNASASGGESVDLSNRNRDGSQEMATNSSAIGASTSGTSASGSSPANPNANQLSSSQPPGSNGSSSSLSQGNAMEPAQPGQDPSLAYSGMTAREKERTNTTVTDGRDSAAQGSRAQGSRSQPNSGSTKATASPAKAQKRPRTSDSGGSAAHQWSSRRHSTNSTAVSRPMNLVVMEDRWMVMRDGAPEKIETTITMEKGPLEARNQLFQAISNRVDSWGVAVSEGYWQPKLRIEVTPSAELSAQRLQKLLEGSDLEAEFLPLQSSKK